MTELKKAIEVAKIQLEIKKLGYQWIEQIFNDKLSNGDCFIELTKNNDPCYFMNHPDGGEMGWGRFERLECWEKVYYGITNKNWERGE